MLDTVCIIIRNGVRIHSESVEDVSTQQAGHQIGGEQGGVFSRTHRTSKWRVSGGHVRAKHQHRHQVTKRVVETAVEWGRQ